MDDDPNKAQPFTPIGTRDDLTRWLEGRSGDTVDKEIQILLWRLAMRVFPLVLPTMKLDGQEQETKNEKRLVLQSFRALVTTRAALAYSASALIQSLHAAQNAVQKLKHFALDAISTKAAQLAADAAGCSSYQRGKSGTTRQYNEQFVNAARFAINELMEIVMAIDGAREDAFARRSVFESLTEDVRALDKGSSADELLNRRLWINDVRSHKPIRQGHNLPDWCRSPFDAFRENRYVKQKSWEKVVDWYRSFLAFDENKIRDGFGEALEFGIVQLPEEVWEGDPDDAMMLIAGIVDRNEVPTLNVSTSLYPPEFDPSPKPTPNPKPEPQPEIIDQTRLHGDQPTSDDLLGRQTFARGLVETIDQVLDEQQVWLEGERQKLRREGRLEQLDGDGFAVHLHAPWGAGKTSVLKMMETRMTSRRRTDSDRWVVVNFNAWRHEKRVPPWRPLIEGLKRDIVRGLDERGHYTPRVKTDCYWFLSNFHARFGPYVYAATILIAAFVAVSWVAALPSVISIIGTGAVTKVVSFVVPLLTAFGAFVLFGQNIVFGSKKDAETHAAHSHDPLKRHRIIFRKLLNFANARVCILIDDLDRCSASYVVDLLEGVQTAFRHENVVYVVAADKNWIRTAFEDVYKPFNRQSETVGQSLGYLFLEKIFQVSTSLPGMGDAVRESYLGELVTDSKMQEVTGAQESLPQTIEAFDEAIDEKRDALREFAEGDVTREVADKWLELNQTAADRAAAGLEIVFSAELEKEFTHRLQSFEHLLPDNPRVIKRLVNAYGFRTLIGFSENNSITPDGLVRWTILEQRFPDAASSFTEHPDWVDQIAESELPVGDKTIPPRLRMFANSAAIREVIGDGDGRLHTEDVRRLTRGSRA